MNRTVDSFNRLQQMLKDFPNERCYNCPFSHNYTDEYRKHMQIQKWTWHCMLFSGWFNSRQCNDVDILKMVLEML